jgi:type IX secretion system PorP/SprF family membrane protein
MRTKMIRRTRTIGKIALLSIVGYLCPKTTHGQADIHFSQFYETSILRNPAMTGVFEDDYKLAAYYRSQWSSITHPYNTFLFSGETHVQIRQTSEDFLSFGILGYEDKAGSIDQQITTFYPALNYNKCLNTDHNTFLSVGFTGGYMQYSFDPSKATFNNQFLDGIYNPSNPSLESIPNAKMTLWDLGAGVNYNTSTGEDNRESYIVGISAYHFTQPKFSYFQNGTVTQNMRLNMNAATSIKMTDFVTVQLQGNYATQGAYRELLMGGLVSKAENTGLKPQFIFSAGMFYRYGDAIIPVVKVTYQSFAVGVSYDVNVSTLKEASNMQGGYEFTISYTGNYTDKGMARKTVCPKF